MPINLRIFSISAFCIVLTACGGDNSNSPQAEANDTSEQNSEVAVLTTTVDPVAFPFSPLTDSVADTNSVPGSSAPDQTSDEPDASDNPQPASPDSTDQTGAPTGTSNSTPGDDTPVDAGSDGEADPLVSREVLPPLNLPLNGSTVGNYRLVNAYPNLNFLEALLVAAVPEENRMIVVEQAGRIMVFENDPEATESNAILDFRSKVAFTGEQGLLGLAFDPDFVSNRYVYINYTLKDTNQSVVSRLRWDPVADVLDAENEEIVITVDQPYHSHNAGMIAFGPDNYLYIAFGDGGDGGDPHNYAQDRSSLLGSLLRLDVHPADSQAGYAIPADNPFVGVPGVREEIYAYGFRNPFRFSFDRANGDIWLGDVGQGEREEINVVVAGGNYGWRVFEGTRPNERALNTLPDSAFIPPVHEYDHATGLSVIGGYVYRGNRVSSLSGRYLYADFYSGVITALNWNGTRITSQTALASVDGPTSFGETHDGDVLVVSRYRGIYRFEERGETIAFPEKLSQTGLFNDIDSLTPVSGLIEYETAHPFWSDGARKNRWIGVPEFKHIQFNANDWWFPIGSVSVKHFSMEMTDGDPLSSRRLETRVLYNTRQGWQGVSYRWNQLQNDATIVLNQLKETLYIKQFDGSIREQEYQYPGTRDCTICHNNASSFLLGLETRQMNIDFEYNSGAQNQIAALNQLQLFNRNVHIEEAQIPLPALTDQSVSVAKRARAYLDVNCSHCHQPGGPAATSLDLRFETANGAIGAIGVAPQQGRLGLGDARIIAPGNKENSILWLRMKSLEDERMPPVASHRIDYTALQVIGEWIDQL